MRAETADEALARLSRELYARRKANHQCTKCGVPIDKFTRCHRCRMKIKFQRCGIPLSEMPDEA